MSIYKLQQAVLMGHIPVRPPPGLEHVPGDLAIAAAVAKQTRCKESRLQEVEAQQSLGNAAFAGLQIPVAKPKLQPPPGKFTMKPPPGCWDANCQSPPDKLSCAPAAVGQSVHLPPPGCFNTGLKAILSQQPIRPPGSWDTMSLASTSAADDGSVPSMGSLPELDWSDEFFDQDGEIEAMPKTKRVTFGMTETLFYELPSCEGDLLPVPVVCKAGGPSKHRLLAGKDGRADKPHGKQSAKNEPILINWQVDAKKLKSSDRQIISPSFELAPQVSIKLMIKPTFGGARRGQASFRNSQGVGSVEIKFIGSSAVAPKLRFCASIEEQALGGPLEHDFGKNPLCTLPKSMQDLDFCSFVKLGSSSLLVSLNVLGMTRHDALP
mmetsp:Transcript_24045/g.44623  ORF Transcript_24045/g.44623 Transcript_24045/m.44623 type:complete len:379 (+) Transcript_24045:74-1210(+)